MKLFAAVPITLLTLNLHGYHPMGEAHRSQATVPRTVAPFGSADASFAKPTAEAGLTDSHLFYFTREELDRGHRRRLDQLAEDMRNIAADLVLLQEVGA